MNNKNKVSSFRTFKEITFDEIIHTIFRRKKTIFITVLSFLILALLFNFFSKSKYKAETVLKKEYTSDRTSYRDEFERRFALQTMDELFTEIEMIKTRSVLEKVIKELGLSLIITEIEHARGKSHTINGSLVEYEWYLKEHDPTQSIFPIIYDVEILPTTKDYEYYIIKSRDEILELYDKKTDNLVFTTQLSAGTLTLPFFKARINWPGADTGDKIYLLLNNDEKTYKKLEKSISISRKSKTSIFTLSVISELPEMAQLLANTIANKYREARLEQKRQTIHYSVEFIDNQMSDIYLKLRDAEFELSSFKSEHKITIMEESSKDLIKAMSELEAEKIKIGLELTDYQNKSNDLKEELNKKGYFDQTYLTPMESGYQRSPFAALLEQLSDAELRRLELLQRRKESHPEVVTIEEQIQQIKARLSDYNENTLTSYRIIINSLKKKRYSLNKLIEKYSIKMENLPSQEARLAELLRDKNVYEKMYSLLMDKREELRVAEFSKLQDIVIIDPAPLPLEPVFPRRNLNLLLSIIAGSLIGITIISIQEFIEKRVVSIDEFENSFNIPILTILPVYTKETLQKISESKKLDDHLVTLMNDQYIPNESFNSLRAKLITMLDNSHNCFMITSCEEGSGKTTIVSNLAISLARAKKRVLIIDCDLRKSKMRHVFNLPKNFPGMVDFLTDSSEVPKLYKPFEKIHPDLNLQILHAGEVIENASELLQTVKLKNLLKLITKKFQYVLVDSPPITKVIDASILGNYVKNTVLVIRPNHTFKDSIPFALAEINQFNMNLLGVVVNAFDVNTATRRYKYGYGYGYGYGKNTSSD